MIAQLDRDYLRTRPTKALQRIISHLLLQGRPLTTPHQWLNGPLLAQYRVAARLPALRRVRKPIFVLGTGRSGTTVLGLVLSMHRDCTFLNEPKALWHAAHGGEDVIGSYSMGDARYTLSAEDATPRVARAMKRIYAYSLLVTASRRVVDKYPELIFRFPCVQAIFPDARHLLLIRNGYDTVHSIAGWSKRNTHRSGSEAHDWWGRDGRKWKLLVRDVLPLDAELGQRAAEIAAFDRQEDMAAVEWALTMRTGLRLLEAHPASVHAVRFEDLCAKPRETLAAATEFCDLPTDERFLAYAQRTLSPVPPRAAIALHPAIEDVFLETMRRLDYSTELQQHGR